MVTKKRPVPLVHEADARSAWERLVAFSDRHAKIIILVCSGLVILIVVLLAKMLYDRTLANRAARELAEARTIPQLRALKEKYRGSAVEPEIVYRLANLYHEEGLLDVEKLAKAEKEYKYFQEQFPRHPLKSPYVDNALGTLRDNMTFLRTERISLLKTPTLQTHPEQRSLQTDRVRRYLEGLKKDPRRMPTLLVGPAKLVNSEVRVTIKGKRDFFVIELNENAAPNTAANLMKLVEENALAGIKIVKTAGEIKVAKKAAFTLKHEPTDAKPSRYDVIVRKSKDRKDLPGSEFEILLRNQPTLKDVVIVGRVTDGKSFVGQLKAGDEIEKVEIRKKREAAYTPDRIKP